MMFHRWRVPHAIVQTALLLCLSKAWIIPLPPWRGLRQLLSVGPWGGKIAQRDAPPLEEVLYLEYNPGAMVPTTNPVLSRIHYQRLPPWNTTTHCRVVATSDTHDKHGALPVPDCDIFIHCGDILQRYGYIGNIGGGMVILQNFAHWLETKTVARHKIVVGGNHDIFLEDLGPAQVQSILSKNKNNNNNNVSINYLHNQPVTVANLTIYGSPWSILGTTGNSAFQRGEDARESARDCVQSTQGMGDIDILVTHASCPQWRDQVVSTKGTKLWVHGHWHDGQGKPVVLPTSRNDSGPCISINVAFNDMIYRPVNPPIVYDVPISFVDRQHDKR